VVIRDPFLNGRMSMVENLIQHVKSLEAEADALVAEARATAQQVEQSAADGVKAFREQFEEEFRRAAATASREQDERVARERAALDKRAAGIADALQSVAPEAAEKAIALILKHLREG
jgi:F0F1-type ATP synthase membrane subunit b/b'